MNSVAGGFAAAELDAIADVTAAGGGGGAGGRLDTMLLADTGMRGVVPLSMCSGDKSLVAFAPIRLPISPRSHLPAASATAVMMAPVVAAPA